MQRQGKPRVLVVDDRPENVDIMSAILSSDYEVRFALNGPKALQIAREAGLDLVLLDIMMPGMDGYAVCQALKENPQTADVPVIFVSAVEDEQEEAKGFALGAVDFIAKPVRHAVVHARVRAHLELRDHKQNLERRVEERTSRLESSHQEIVRRLGVSAEYRDDVTGLHVARVSHYTRLIAESLGLDSDTVSLMAQAAPLHDVGKIGVPDRILMKPGALDEAEWTILKKHTIIGSSILKGHESLVLEMGRTIALSHHEKWDGSGYPYGLTGDSIPLAGRIIALADVFDALTSDRPFRGAWDFDEAVEFVCRGRGTHFDPAVLDAFVRVLPAIRQAYEQGADFVG